MENTNITDKLELIQEYLDQERFDYITDIFDTLHAADISELLNHFSRGDDRFTLFTQINKDKWPDVMVELEAPILDSIINRLQVEEISDVINELDADDATDIVGELETEKIEEVLSHVDDEQKQEVLELLAYDENSAGGIMGKEYVAVLESTKVNEIIQIIREKKDEISDLYNIWVVDQRDRLLGIINLKDLVLARGSKTAGDIMTEDYLYVEVDMDQQEVARIFEKYNLIEAAVVDSKHQIIGHITIDDIVDVIEEEAQEDIFRLAGTNDEEIKEIALTKIIKARIPWLIIALFAGLLNAIIMSKYNQILDANLILTYFIPVVIAMGGNVGVQSSSIVIRGLGTGEINLFDMSYRLFKELSVALSNGLIVGLILFGIINLVWANFTVALVCSVSMIIAMFIAGLVGSAVPFILKKLNLDPALSSGPFVTTSNDIIGVFIYLLVANILLI